MRAQFIGQIAPTASAFQLHGVEGYRITIDIPESEREAVLEYLANMRGELIEFTAEIQEKSKNVKQNSSKY